MFTIRPFENTDADYAMMTAIDTAVFMEFPRTAEEWRHDDASRSQDYLFCREMIELNGEVIAFGEYGQSQFNFHPQKYNFYRMPRKTHLL